MLFANHATYTEGLSENRNGVSTFLHGDILGSLRLTTVGQGITDTLVYDGFGVTVADTNPQATPLKFVGAKGYQSDADTGLQLLGHRYYDPNAGRFLSSDPVQDGDNWYAYCENNPLGKVDPSGEAFQPGGGSDLGSIGGQYDFNSPFDSFHTDVMIPPMGQTYDPAPGNVGHSQSNEDLDKLITDKKAEINKGGLSKPDLREAQKKISEWINKKKANDKQAGQRRSRVQKNNFQVRPPTPVIEQYTPPWSPPTIDWRPAAGTAGVVGLLYLIYQAAQQAAAGGL